MSNDSNNTILIRQINASDGGRVFEFFRGLGGESRRTFRPHEFTRENAEWVAVTSDGDSCLRLAACENGEIVGYGFFERSYSRDFPLVGLAVVDRLHGQGIGQRLIDALSAEARRLGTRGLQLTAVKDNARAQHIYAKAGYRYTGESACGNEYAFRLTFPVKDGPGCA